jgi:hypothetical protein
MKPKGSLSSSLNLESDEVEEGAAVQAPTEAPMKEADAVDAGTQQQKSTGTQGVGRKRQRIQPKGGSEGGEGAANSNSSGSGGGKAGADADYSAGGSEEDTVSEDYGDEFEADEEAHGRQRNARKPTARKSEARETQRESQGRTRPLRYV